MEIKRGKLQLCRNKKFVGQPILIRTTPVKTVENVFALRPLKIGNLRNNGIKKTVNDFPSNNCGLEDIQANANIHSSNSIGELVNNGGNVVGIAYARTGGSDGYSTGLDLFIPVQYAL